MLEWATPLWFLALPVALLAPWLSGRPAAAFSSLANLQARITPRLLLARLPQVLLSVGLVFMVVALARPQHVDRERVRETEGIDIMLVLDTSSSMEAADYRLGGTRANRLEVAKEVLARFVEGRPDDRVGLVVFGEEAYTQVPLTLDHDGMARLLGQVQLGMAGGRATAIGDALAVASQRLKDLDAPSKIVILLTDGRSNAGDLEPLEAAEAAKALGIKVYTIGVGSASGGGVFGMFRGGGGLDERSLQAIAQLTGGRYYRATDTSTLSQVYENIDELETTTAKIKELVFTEERYHPFLALGLALSLLSLLLGETLLRRLP